MRRGILVVAALAAAVALPAAAEGVVDHPDKLSYKDFKYVPPQAKDYRAQLKAGPVVFIAEDHELPLVSLVVTLRGGTYLDPAGKEGLAETTGFLLARGGTASRSAEQLEERLAFLAAQLNSGYSDDRGTVSLNLLSKDLDEGLRILREVLTQPRFQDDRLKLRKDQVLNDMKQRNDESAPIEAREMSILTRGEDHYTNRFSTKASIEAISKADLVAFHEKWFDLRNVSVAVAGDFKRAEMLAKLETLFRSWPVKGQVAGAVPAPKHEMKPGLYVVDKDVNQGRVSILMPSILRTDPDYFPGLVMNDILGGGGFTSRITNRVRSDEGLAYSAGSGLGAGVWYPGALRGAFQSKVRTCAYATQIVLEEMKKIREAEVSDDELKTAKASFIDTLPRAFTTKAATVAALLNEEFTGRAKTDPTFYATYAEKVANVSKADVLRVAKRLVQPDKATILAVGKKADMLNPDPKHPVDYASLAGGKLVDVPLRDPLTMKPMAK